MNPFENYHAYYSAVKIDFCQRDYLQKDEDGFCIALTISWLEDIFISQGKNFFKLKNSPSYISAAKKEQKECISVAEKLLKKGFSNQDDFSLQKKLMEDKNIKSAVEKFREEKAILFFLEKEKNDPGHVIAVAKTSEGISIFDSNYGELFFRHDSQININRKTVFEINHIIDSWQESPIYTYEDAVANLLYFYTKHYNSFYAMSLTFNPEKIHDDEHQLKILKHQVIALTIYFVELTNPVQLTMKGGIFIGQHNRLYRDFLMTFSRYKKPGDYSKDIAEELLRCVEKFQKKGALVKKIRQYRDAVHALEKRSKLISLRNQSVVSID